MDKYEMPEYKMYRGKKIPGWWRDFLPWEENPYETTDTLTLEKGCLAEYLYLHFKYPESQNIRAYQRVRSMIRERFGAAFLGSVWWSGGRPSKNCAMDSNHLTYKNAYIGADNNIHIWNAQKYYEDVIVFLLELFQRISRDCMRTDREWDFGAISFFSFFPYTFPGAKD